MACGCKEGASLLILISFGLAVGGSVLGGEPLVLLLDFRELPHVLEEVRATLQRDQELRLLAALRALVGALALAGDWDSHSADGLELGVLVPHEVLRGNDAGGDGVAKSVQLDGLMDLEVALTEEHVEVGVFLHRDIDLTRVLWKSTRGGLGTTFLILG